MVTIRKGAEVTVLKRRYEHLRGRINLSKNTYSIHPHSLDGTVLTGKNICHVKPTDRKSMSRQSEYRSLTYSHFHHYKLMHGDHAMYLIHMMIIQSFSQQRSALEP